VPSGRFAPSPTGELHLGNLRTALLAWLFARSTGAAFLVRMEDLDRATSSRVHEAAQLRDLAALGIDWDGPVVRQSERFDRYRSAIDRLATAGLTYPCYCTRREIREASSAPHGDSGGGAGGIEGGYPGTCRHLTMRQRAAREAEGRPPAIRLRTDAPVVEFTDRLHGRVQGVVDDVVLARNDGVPAYNLAVVVDDAQQGVEEVVRGDDLLTSTPRQIHLARLLDLPIPSYAHVPLVLGADGTRLAKRHGAVTLSEIGAGTARLRIAASLGLCTAEERDADAVTTSALLTRFDPDRLPRRPWVIE
jgi:glutamyl-tRNA synthetase